MDGKSSCFVFQEKKGKKRSETKSSASPSMYNTGRGDKSTNRKAKSRKSVSIVLLAILIGHGKKVQSFNFT